MLNGIIKLMIGTRFSKHCRSGFTLIEIMVALFIMTVATGLLLANYPDSTVRLTLLNSTHNLALLIREAQIRGSAVDTASSTLGGYGVFIDSATSSQSILFGDATAGLGLTNSAGFSIGDGLYNANNSQDVIKNILKLNSGFTFKKLCVGSSTAPIGIAPYGFLCDTTNIPPVRSLTISFARPSQTAHIYMNNSTTTDFTSACIQLYSLKTPEVGHIRSVWVFHSGVVTTTTSPCN